jgi:glycosyltransferase involved in cell wall biosynthesis
MLAIIIPYYKHAFFEETLQSLSNQTDKRFKVYVGDDASPENPTYLLNRYQGKFDWVYHRFETNKGVVSLTQQWERCIELSTNEEWIMVLGDDDYLGDTVVEQFYFHMNEIEQLKIDVVRYATVVVNQENEKISIIHTHPKLEKSIDFLMRKLKGGTRSSLSEFVFRKKKLQHIGFKNLPLAWYSDVLAFMEVSGFGFVYSINVAVVSFRLSGLNITSKIDNLKIKNIATFEFYHYLLNEKKEFFDSDQINVLMGKLERTFLDNKKNIYFWSRFTKLYVSNFYFKKYGLFIVKTVKSVYKKHNI